MPGRIWRSAAAPASSWVGIRTTLPDAELAGSEIFSTGLAFAAERVPSATFYQMDARMIPFRDEFDLVGAFDVIEHIDDDAAVLRSVHGALRPGGSLLLSVPQHPALWSAQDEHAFHVRRYTAGGLRRRLDEAGFDVVRMTSFVSLLLPVMFLSRKRTSVETAEQAVDAMGDLRQTRPVNVALEAVMSIERALIRAGLSFPAGGSLLVVASKRAERARVIPFNRPYMTGKELEYIAEAHANGHLAGNGAFSKRCCAWLEERIGSQKALLTHSATAALEMAAILSGVGPGDEVIMPSFAFVSSANAFVLRGATPVFVDVRPDTLNLDETLIEAAITPRTKAIVPIHYAGVGCEMDTIMAIAGRHDLLVIEDAAQGIVADIGGRPLGGIGHMAALSFHETKNIISGEGGALLINDPRFMDRAEIVWEKGTNRSQFFRGQVDKYTWVDLGSSFLPGEIVAAFLWAQLEEADAITRRRLDLWEAYDRAFVDLEGTGAVRRPIVPPAAGHNGHLYTLDAARPVRPYRVHRPPPHDRDPVGLPLRAAPLLALRRVRRPVGGRPLEHRRRQRAARSATPLVGA